MSEVRAVKWTIDMLRSKSPEQRYNIWVNAKRRDTPEAREVVMLIETSGLEYAESGGISLSDPRVIEMGEIIDSPEGRAACVDATRRGEPALAGVEPMIVEKMGDRYGSFSQMTVTAGSLVGELMYSLGYDKAPARRMPAGSVAKTAATWKLRKA